MQELPFKKNTAEPPQPKVRQALASLWLALIGILLFCPLIICAFECKTQRCQFLLGGYSYWFGPGAFSSFFSLCAIMFGVIFLAIGAWKHVLSAVMLCCVYVLGNSIFLQPSLNCEKISSTDMALEENIVDERRRGLVGAE